MNCGGGGGLWGVGALGGVASRLEPLVNGTACWRNGSLSGEAPIDGLLDTGGVGEADSSIAEGAVIIKQITMTFL